DNAWYARFADNHSPRVALDAELHTGRAQICAALLAAVQRWEPWIATLDAARWDGALTYTRNNGQTMHVPFAPTLGHVFNHATHHRGQITAAITALGQPCPELDWVYKLYQEQAAP
ncbi:MAG: DinB family protein, partial [Burkholderiaceae bacterium]|nr:DinB family protein [Burkholderiaceae bacterium]